MHRNFLLSSSADTTVKLWDLNNSTCVQSYNHHSDKVQAVAWNPVEATAFVSGGYDKSICVLDARSPDNVTRWTIESDVESIVWDPHNPTNFYLAMENGMVQYYDVRVVANGAGGKAIFTLQAHDGAVSALDVNPVVPNCIATGSTDKLVKVWNTTDNRPSMVASRNFELVSCCCCGYWVNRTKSSLGYNNRDMFSVPSFVLMKPWNLLSLVLKARFTFGI